MRNAFIAALMLLTAACGAYAFPGGSSGSTGAVGGTVVAVPCSPVETIGNPCTGRPVPNLEIDFAKGSSTLRTVTDPKGNYSIDLPVGTWNVTLKGYMRKVSGPPSVTVTAGSNLVANFVLDSGIRIPLPAPQPQPGG
jgi:hypothetical protein